MVGSPRSKSTSSLRLFVALLAALAMLATACGGSDATSLAVDDVESADAVDSADTADEPTVETTSDEPEPEPAEAVDAPEAAEAEVDDELDEKADAAEPEEPEESDEDEAASGSSGPIAQVLSFALENSESQSYSFSQGMSMKMNIAGEELNIASGEPFVFGQVDGDAMYMEMNMGTFMGAMMSSFGIDVTEAPFDAMFDGLNEASIETWTDETTMVMDLSKFAAAIGDLDPEAAGELSEFADGPIKIDLTKIEGVDPATIASEFGQGAQVTDPSLILQTLRAVDAIEETGTDSVNGRDVRTFASTMALVDYYDALGVDFIDQLDAANLGDVAPEDAETFEALLDSLSDVEMSLVVMIDGDDLVRRMETSIDMGAMISAMFSNEDVLSSIAEEEGQSVDELQAEMDDVLGDGLELSIDTWQEFDNYGEAFVIEPPDAVDVTADFDLAS